APTSQKPPKGAKLVNVETAAQMFDAVKKYFSICDCLIMAAAVADYTPYRPSGTKIKKSGKSMTIKFKSTTDILKWADKHKKQGRLVVGFALEDKAVRVRAEKKLKDKNLDMIVVNTPAAIGVDKSTVQIKTPDSPWIKIENVTKITTAKRIIRLIQNL
ncbi:MAG: phosphopantothenoylcysteine decarboxylase domain-containing protein, partial [Planctomycetota bacterium]